MGMADLVPGVSGGTIAFLYGIYDELLYSIKLVTGTVPRLLLKGKFKQAVSVVPFGFLLPVFIGIASAILGLVHAFTYLLDNYPVYLWSVFFGLVVGSAFVIKNRIKKWQFTHLLLAVAAFLATFILLGLPKGATSSTSLFVTFMTGAIASCAMILPGISGSLIMVMLGQYQNVIGYVSERRLQNIVVFVGGAIGGLALFSRLLSWLLHRYHNATIATLIGIMMGSLRRVWPWQSDAGVVYRTYLPEFSLGTLFAVLLIAAGFAFVWLLEKKGIAREHDDIQSKDFVNTSE